MSSAFCLRRSWTRSVGLKMPAEVPGYESPFIVAARVDARERMLEEADEEEDLAHRADDEPVVRLPARVGAGTARPARAHERGHDHADRREHAHAAVLELGLAEPRDHARVAAREVHGVEVAAAAGGLPLRPRWTSSRNLVGGLGAVAARGAAGATSAEAPVSARASARPCIFYLRGDGGRGYAALGRVGGSRAATPAVGKRLAGSFGASDVDLSQERVR